MAGVVLTALLSRMGKRLTGESSHNDIWVGVGEVGPSDIANVSQYRNVGPMMPKHRLAVRFVLNKTCRLEGTSGLKPSRKATDPREQIQRGQHGTL